MSAVANFTEECIKKAFREVMDANSDKILHVDAYRNLTEADMLSQCVNDLYSEALRLYANKHAESIYPCDGLYKVHNIGKCLDDVRSSAGIELVQKLWEKPAVCVGRQYGKKSGYYDKFNFATNYVTYMDTDGEVFVVEEYSIFPYGYTEHVAVVFRKMCDSKECMSLNYVQEMFPKYLWIF